MGIRWFLVAFVFLLISDQTASACREVGPIDKIAIDEKALARLQKSNITRTKLFEAVKQVSETETSGCWGGATGDFDDQLVSVGALQWNYGQESLPPKLRTLRSRLGDTFDTTIKALMPTHGKLIFSPGCLQDQITSDCRSAIVALMNGDDLPATLATEFNALFESDDMIQIQMDSFVALVETVQDDLTRLFPGKSPGPRMIQWAIDSKVQMKKPFPGDATIRRSNKHWATLDTAEKKKVALLALVDWYSGSSYSVDQGGTKFDRACNVKYWRQRIASGVSDEQAQLLNLSYLASRQASGREGFWQALTFQRHARIILGVGSVAEHRLGIPSGDPCITSQ